MLDVDGHGGRVLGRVFDEEECSVPSRWFERCYTGMPFEAARASCEEGSAEVSEGELSGSEDVSRWLKKQLKVSAWEEYMRRQTEIA